MLKKPTCKSCAAYKDTSCPGKTETCSDYKYRGNRHKGDKKKEEVQLVRCCGDDSCKYYDKESLGKCKKNKGKEWIENECKFWDIKISDALGISEKETDELIAKANQPRMPDNALHIESSRGKKGKFPAKGGIISSDIGLIPKKQTPRVEKIIAKAGTEKILLSELLDLIKKYDIEIIIRPAGQI